MSIRDDCEQKFAAAMPPLKAAINGLKKLSKGDLTELKTIKSPTPVVRSLMTCVCIILDVKPKLVKIPGKVNEFKEDWWATA
jgi:dynein heavy chain